MPASMISAPTGASEKVIGSSIATVATMPMPGSTPTSVPTSAPRRQKPILDGCAATVKPSARLWKRSNIVSPRSEHEGRPQRERQFENPGEQRDAEQCQVRACDQALAPARLARTGDRDDEGGEGRQDEAERWHEQEPLHHHREGAAAGVLVGRPAKREGLDRGAVGEQ